MNSSTQNSLIPGNAGQLEIAINLPSGTSPVGITLIAHPNPARGGTMEHKIVHTLARTFLQMNYATVRFNYRGVGKSEGEYDEGKGETDDAETVLNYAQTHLGLNNLVLAGFSFGSFIQVALANRLTAKNTSSNIKGLVLVGPAVGSFPIADIPEHLPSVIIQGQDDEIISTTEVLLWAYEQKRPVVIFPKCGHFFHGRLLELQHELLQRRAVFAL